MAAMDKLRSKKTKIVDILSADRRIFDKVQEKGIILQREYNNVTNINKENAEGHVIALLDKIMNKGEETCQKFLTLLQTDEDIKSTYPALENILTDNTDGLQQDIMEQEQMDIL